MKIKLLFLLACFVVSLSVQAEVPYQQQGNVISTASQHTIVVINDQRFRIEHETLMKGDYGLERGTLAPILEIDMQIGFNVEQNYDAMPRITEVGDLD